MSAPQSAPQSAPKIDVGYALPWGGGPLQTLLERRLPAHGISAPCSLDRCWGPAHYRLDQVGAFQRATPAQRREVLAGCARGYLLEAYFIEKAGVSYAAKMILLAERAEERSLYAVFAAEEASHLAALQASLGPVDEGSWRANPFLELLEQIIVEADREVGQLIIQVALEGWSLMHYAQLRDACEEPALRALLGQIVADEAAHHGSGVQLLRDVSLSARQQAQAVELLGEMLRLVQLGPLLIVGTLERALGGFSGAERAQVYRELDREGHIRARLEKLQRCLRKVDAAQPVLDALTARGAFTVPSAPSPTL